MEQSLDRCRGFALKARKRAWPKPCPGRQNGVYPFLLRRIPATKATVAASSHSMRHTCTACQSRTVLAVYMNPVATAAITHATPTIRHTKDAADNPIDSRIRVNSSQSVKLRDPLSVTTSRSAPQTWQKREPTTNSVPHSGQAKARDCVTASAWGPRGGCQKS